MLHEKPHDSFHWRNKLDELGHLPGEPLADKAAAWEKLQVRMQGRSRKRRIIPYWMVAASLLVIIGVSWFTRDQTNAGLLNGEKQPTGKNPATASMPLINKKDTVAQILTVQKERKPAIAIESINKRPDRIQLETASSDEKGKQNQDIAIEPLPEITNSITNYVDTAAAIAVLPSKKKLRVVHINELMQPGEEINSVGKNTAPAFQTKPFAQDDGLISISRNASDNLIKIKLSPSN